MEVSIMRVKKKLKLLSYVYVEKLQYLIFGFGQTYFLVHFTMFGPTNKINFTFGGKAFCVSVCNIKLDVAKMACNIKKPKTTMTPALKFTHDDECHLCLKSYCTSIHDDPHIKSLSIMEIFCPHFLTTSL
jgi:hypothetical protein